MSEGVALAKLEMVRQDPTTLPDAHAWFVSALQQPGAAAAEPLSVIGPLIELAEICVLRAEHVDMGHDLATKALTHTKIEKINGGGGETVRTFNAQLCCRALVCVATAAANAQHTLSEARDAILRACEVGECETVAMEVVHVHKMVAAFWSAARPLMVSDRWAELAGIAQPVARAVRLTLDTYAPPSAATNVHLSKDENKKETEETEETEEKMDVEHEYRTLSLAWCLIQVVCARAFFASADGSQASKDAMATLHEYLAKVGDVELTQIVVSWQLEMGIVPTEENSTKELEIAVGADYAPLVSVGVALRQMKIKEAAIASTAVDGNGNSGDTITESRLQALVDRLFDVHGVRSDGAMLLASWDPDTHGKRRRLALDLLVLIGEVAHERGFDSLARRCASHAGAATSAEAANVRAIFLNAVCDLSKQTTSQTTYTRTAVATRLDVLKRLQVALSTAKVAGTPTLVQQGCLLLWNICLPLLQPDLRRSCRRSLTLASDTLHALDSPLHTTRCLMHIELAKIGMDAELYSVVETQLRRARLLAASGGIKAHTAGCWTFIDSLERDLRSRDAGIAHAARGGKPESPVEAAARLVAQAGSLRNDPAVARSALVQAGRFLLPDIFTPSLLPDMALPPPPGDGSRRVGSSSSSSTRASASANGRRKNKSKGAAAGGAGESGDGDVNIHGDANSSSGGVPTVPYGANGGRGRGGGGGVAARSDAAAAAAGKGIGSEEMKRMAALAGAECTDRSVDTSQVWIKMAETARRSGLWDIGYTAAGLALTAGAAAAETENSDLLNGDGSSSNDGKDPKPTLSTRIMSSLHTIRSECLLRMLMVSGIRLGLHPSPPRGVDAASEDWTTYCAWADARSTEVLEGFVAAANLGVVTMHEDVVQNAAAFVLNHCVHLRSLVSSGANTGSGSGSGSSGTLSSSSSSSLTAMMKGEASLARLAAPLSELHVALGKVPSTTHDGVAVRAALAQIHARALLGTATIREKAFVAAQTAAAPISTTTTTTTTPLVSPSKKKGGKGSKNATPATPAPPAHDPAVAAAQIDAVGVCVQALDMLAVAKSGAYEHANELALTLVRARRCLGQALDVSKLPEVVPLRALCLLAAAEEVEEEAVMAAVAEAEAEAAEAAAGKQKMQAKLLCTALEQLQASAAPSPALSLPLRLRALLRLALRAQALKTWAEATHAARLVLALIARNNKKMSSSSSSYSSTRTAHSAKTDEHKCYLAHCVLARAILCEVSITEDAGEQAKIRHRALSHLLAAAKHARASGDTLAQETAAGELWNAALPLASEAATRAALLDPLCTLLPQLPGLRQEAPDANSVTLRVRLFLLALECLADASRWDDGLAMVDAAVKKLPRGAVGALWTAKLLFKSRTGQAVAGEIQRLSDRSDLEKSRIWATLAATERSIDAQKHALREAVVLSRAGAEDGGAAAPHYADSLVRLGQWLGDNESDATGARAALQQAVDTLDVYLEQSTQEVEAVSEPQTTQITASIATETREDCANQEENGDETIGVAAETMAKASVPAEGSSSAAPVPDAVARLSALVLMFRAGVMRAMLLPRDRNERVLACRDACDTVKRLWSQLLDAAASAAMAAVATAANGDATLAVATFPPLPSNSPVEWADYVIPPQSMDALTAANSQSVAAEPEETCYYALCLADLLAEDGLEPLALPSLALVVTLAHDRPLAVLARARIAVAARRLGSSFSSSSSSSPAVSPWVFDEAQYTQVRTEAVALARRPRYASITAEALVPARGYRALLAHARLCLNESRPADAVRPLTEGAALARLLDDVRAEADARILEGRLALERGQPAAAERALRGAAPAPKAPPQYWAEYASVLCAALVAQATAHAETAGVDTNAPDFGPAMCVVSDAIDTLRASPTGDACGVETHIARLLLLQGSLHAREAEYCGGGHNDDTARRIALLAAADLAAEAASIYTNIGATLLAAAAHAAAAEWQWCAALALVEVTAGAGAALPCRRRNEPQYRLEVLRARGWLLTAQTELTAAANASRAILNVAAAPAAAPAASEANNSVSSSKIFTCTADIELSSVALQLAALCLCLHQDFVAAESARLTTPRTIEHLIADYTREDEEEGGQQEDGASKSEAAVWAVVERTAGDSCAALLSTAETTGVNNASVCERVNELRGALFAANACYQHALAHVKGVRSSQKDDNGGGVTAAAAAAAAAGPAEPAGPGDSGDTTTGGTGLATAATPIGTFASELEARALALTERQLAAALSAGHINVARRLARAQLERTQVPTQASVGHLLLWQACAAAMYLRSTWLDALPPLAESREHYVLARLWAANANPKPKSSANDTDALLAEACVSYAAHTRTCVPADLVMRLRTALPSAARLLVLHHATADNGGDSATVAAVSGGKHGVLHVAAMAGGSDGAWCVEHAPLDTSQLNILRAQAAALHHGPAAPSSQAVAELTAKMNDLFGPLFLSASSGALLDVLGTGTDVIICADAHLLELPLEALGALRLARSVAREFGAQLLLSRLEGSQKTQSDPILRGADTDRGSKANSSKGRRGSKTGTSAAAAAAAAAAAVVMAPIDPAAMPRIPIAARLTLVGDPAGHTEDNRSGGGGSSDSNIGGDNESGAVHTVTHTLSRITRLMPGGVAATPPAAMANGTISVVGGAAARELVRNAEAMVVVGSGSSLAALGVDAIVSAAPKSLRFVMLLDRQQCAASEAAAGLRRVAQGAPKTMLESPVPTAALLSLCGACAVALNVWPVSPEVNSARAERLIQAVFKTDVGAAVHSLLAPPPTTSIEEGGEENMAKEDEMMTATTFKEEEQQQEAEMGNKDEAAATDLSPVTTGPVYADNAFGHVLYGLPSLVLT